MFHTRERGLTLLRLEDVPALGELPLFLPLRDLKLSGNIDHPAFIAPASSRSSD